MDKRKTLSAAALRSTPVARANYAASARHGKVSGVAEPQPGRAARVFQPGHSGADFAVIQAALSSFVRDRPGGALSQSGSLCPESSLSSGELEALRQVGLQTTASTASTAAKARERALHGFFALIENSASTASVAERLGVVASRIRQRIRERSLYAFEVGGEHRIPLDQFVGKRELPGLKEVLSALPEDMQPVEFSYWLNTPIAALQIGRTKRLSPRDWLLQTGDTRPLLALAAEL